VGEGADIPRARLAELVAALSLGVDLGFGQPMEHVLRQCLIALRLADHAGLGEVDRMAVYYTALLVNVGCHADAHEQAKWFGDDIALKSGKYAHELGSVRGTLATMRLVGAGNPPLHRFRVGLEFAFSGHRQLDGMISQHARLARTLAEQLELPSMVREGVGAAYEQWDGRGWPGTLKAGALPVAARIAQLAEFTEVAHRVGGVAGATVLARRRAGRQFDPALVALLCAQAEQIFGSLETVPAWRTVIAAGHRRPRRREALAGPAALTAREVEVLVLLARGLSNKQIAERLVITPKTAGNHVEHIYAKIDASSRAAAAMFAVQHGLLPEEKMRQSPHAPAAGPRLPSCLRFPKEAPCPVSARTARRTSRMPARPSTEAATWTTPRSAS
jgi:DNA-binding CsgD family transcriptional regulator